MRAVLRSVTGARRHGLGRYPEAVTDANSTTDKPAIQFRSDVTVELVRASAHDSDVLFAARVSTQGEQTLEAVHDADLDTIAARASSTTSCATATARRSSTTR